MKCYDLSTEQLRNALPPRRKPYWFHIRRNNHLGIVVLRTGKRWVVRYRNKDSEYTSTTLGPVGIDGEGLNFKRALVLAEKTIQRMKEGKQVKSPERVVYNGELIFCPIGDIFTVGHAIRNYMEWKRIAATPASFSAALSLINYHIAPRLSHIPLADFNGSHFHDFCVDVLETPAKIGHSLPLPKTKISNLSEEALRKRKGTLNTLVSTLRVAFTLAWERGEIDSDMPIRCLRRLPNYERPRSKFLDREECRTLLSCCGPAIKELVAGALYSGCRVTELTNLKVSDVAKDGFGITIRKAKNYKARFVYLPDEGMAFFLEQIKGKSDDEYVFLSPSGNPWRFHYSYQFKKAVAKAGLSNDVVFHTLRHTYASQLVQSGASLGAVAKQLGHSNTNAVDKTYGHLVPGIAGTEIQKHFETLDVSRKTATSTQRKLGSLRKKMAKLPPPEIHNDNSWPKANFSRHHSELLYELSPSTRRFRAT